MKKALRTYNPLNSFIYGIEGAENSVKGREFRTFYLVNFYRYVGAVLVAIAHYTAYFPLEQNFRAHLFGALHPLMGFFFALSGFVIMHVYGGHITSFAHYGVYLQKRLARIYPIFIATFMISCVYAIYTHNHSDMFAPSAILPNILLIHAWNTTKMLTFDYPSWSVSAEMFVYLLFPVFLFMVDRMRAFAFALPFILAAVVAGVFFVFGLGNWVDATFNGGCLMATPSFVSGMIVQRLLTRNLASFRAPAWVAHAMALATVPLALAGVPGSIMLFYMTMLVFVMVAAEPERPGLLSRPFARNLANASYGFYLLHIPVADIVLRSLVRRLSFPPAATYALAPVAIIVTTMLAVASFRYFEDPLRRYLGSPILRLASKSRIIGDGKHLVKDAL